MKEVSEIKRSVGGHEIATLAEIQSLAYEVPEDAIPPASFTAFAAGKEVEPETLYEDLSGPFRQSLAANDRASQTIETLLYRLRRAFPGLG